MLRVDPTIKNEIDKLGKRIFIGLSACKVIDRYHILQCYKCQQFGHKKGSSNCPLINSDKEVCLYCSGNHPSRSCPEKANEDSFKCNNCLNSKDPSVRSNSTGHKTTSINCPFLQHSLKLVIDRTMGASFKRDIPKTT